jgi:TPR repeat protein
MHYRGTEVAQNYTEAARFFQMAADRGVAVTQNNLGHMYLYGHGVAQNNTEATEWLDKAAGQGNPEARKALKRLQEQSRPSRPRSGGSEQGGPCAHGREEHEMMQRLHGSDKYP